MLLRVVPEEGQNVLPEELNAVGEGAALIDIAFEPVSSNRSLRCGETEFSARRQRGRNDLGDSTTPVQRQNHARQLRQFGATAGGVIRKFELTGLFEPKSPQPVSSNRNLRCGETEFSGQRQRGRKGFAGSRTPLQRQNFAKQPRPFGGYSARTGKSPLERECVVGLRGLELRARQAVLSNQSLSLPQCCKRGRIKVAP